MLVNTSGIFLPHFDGEEPLALQQKIVGSIDEASRSVWELIEHKVDTFTSLKWWSTCGRWISAKRCPGLALHSPCQLGRLRQSELLSPAEM